MPIRDLTVQLYGPGTEDRWNVAATHIDMIRRKIQEVGLQIINVRHVGYRIEVDA